MAVIELDHIVEFTWRCGPESVERPNLVRLWYYSPERDYEMTEVELQKFNALGAFIGPAWARIQDEIDRVGEQPMDIKLPFCPSAAQAQRLARRLFAIARADVGQVRTTWAGLAQWGNRVTAIELPDGLLGAVTETGPNGNPFTVAAIAPPRVDDERGQVEIPFALWPSLAAWNTSTDEVDPPEQLPQLASGDALNKPAAPTEANVVTNGDGTTTRIAIGPFDANSVNVEVCYRTMVATGGLPLSAWKPMSIWHDDTIFTPGNVFMAEEPLNLAGTPCEFRVRQFDNDNGRGSQWSNTLKATPAIDNTQTAAPTIVATYDDPTETTTIVVTAPLDVNVAYLRLTGDGVGDEIPDPIPCKPDEEFTFEVPTPRAAEQRVETWTAQAFTTGDVGSAIAQDDVTIPAI